MIKYLILGNNLDKSVEIFFNEMPTPTLEAKGKLVSSVIKRLTRIGFIGILITSIPTILLFIQNNKIEKQNSLFEKQNYRLIQQTHLQEAERRSSINFLTSNVLDKMDDELKNTKNNDRELTDELIGRIASLSYAMKPYKYLKDDNLTLRELSPERGQLFISLMNSRLKRETMSNVFWKSNFEDAEMNNSNFENLDFSTFIIQNASLKDSRFTNCRLAGTEFGGCDFEDSEIELDSIFTNFFSCNLKNVEFNKFLKTSRNNNMKYGFNDAILDSTLFNNINLSDLSFGNQDLSTTIFKNCQIPSKDINQFFGATVTGITKLMENHEIVSRDDKYYLNKKIKTNHNNGYN